MSHRSPALSPALHKALRAKHPLYSKLSGDVVWCIFEELGYSAEACERAMDDFFATMNQTLTLIQQVEAGEVHAFTVHSAPATTAPPCAPLGGLSVSCANPAWITYLPPFAVGCQCTALAASALAAAPVRELAPPPHCGLVCPLLEATKNVCA